VWLARIPAVKHHLNLDDGQLGLALLAAPAGLVLLMPLAGRLGLLGDRLAVRFGSARLVRGCAVVAAGGLAAGLIRATPAGAVVGFALFGADLSRTFPQLLSAAGRADPARPGRGIARVAGLGYLGMLGGPVLIGSLADVAGLPTALGIPVILMVCVALTGGVVAPRPAQGS
jgi:hypothetical protein